MRIPKEIPNELKRLINAIVKRFGDCENLLMDIIETHGDSPGMALP